MKSYPCKEWSLRRRVSPYKFRVTSCVKGLLHLTRRKEGYHFYKKEWFAEIDSSGGSFSHWSQSPDTRQLRDQGRNFTAYPARRASMRGVSRFHKESCRIYTSQHQRFWIYRYSGGVFALPWGAASLSYKERCWSGRGDQFFTFGEVGLLKWSLKVQPALLRTLLMWGMLDRSEFIVAPIDETVRMFNSLQGSVIHLLASKNSP